MGSLLPAGQFGVFTYGGLNVWPRGLGVWPVDSTRRNLGTCVWEEQLESLQDALTLFRQHRSWIDDFLADKFVLWLGSGISRERFPPLTALLRHLVDDLSDRRTTAPAYERALQEIFQVAGFSCPRATDPWPPAIVDAVVTQLVDRYAIALDVVLGIDGYRRIKDLLKLPERYSDPGVTPDVDHRFLALLIAEGVCGEMISTNWDPLIERACVEARIPPLAVVAAPSDIEGAFSPRLMKIHGCAQLTVSNRDKYARFFVATDTEIKRWAITGPSTPLADVVRAVVRQRAVLIVGSSVQDANIQLTFLSTALPGSRSPQPPKVVFAEKQLQPTQRQLLSLLYAEYAEHKDEIERVSLMPLYSKPLFGTLFVFCLYLKALRLLSVARDAGLPEGWCKDAESGASYALNWLNTAMEAKGASAAWIWLADVGSATVAAAVRLYSAYAALADTRDYRALVRGPVQHITENPIPTALGDHRFAIFLGLVYEGVRLRIWELTRPEGISLADGTFRITRDGTSRRVFVLRDDSGLRALYEADVIDVENAPDAVCVYARGRTPVRSPQHGVRRAFPGGTVTLPPGAIYLEEFFSDVPVDREIVTELAAEVLS